MTRTLRELTSLLDAPRGRLVLASLLGATTVLFGVGLMASAGYLISRASERPAILSLMVAIVVVRIFGLGRPVIRYLERLTSHDLALRVLGRVRARFYTRIEPLAPAQLDSYRTGDLLSRMVADVDVQQDLYLRALGPPVVALVAGGVSVGVAAAFLPSAALVLVGGLIAGALVGPALSGYAGARASRRQAAARGELTAELIELFSSAPETVAFGAEDERLARVSQADSSLVTIARRDALATGMGDGIGLVLTGITVAGVVAAAAAASAHRQLNPVSIALLALLALASFEAVTPLAAATRSFSATLAAGRRLLELTQTPAAVVDPPEPLAAPEWPFTVALEHVRAGYPSEHRPALDGLSLRLAPGDRVALVGPSGAGKTTIVNLLLRFLDPEAGRLTLAGRDLRLYRQADIRRAIAVAGQESHLFTSSIRHNLRLARPEASDWELEQALRQARIWDWVSELPDQMDTIVGEQGGELSGGQRQRLVLARALLVDAPVLVLDEPTAHLDPDTATKLVADVLAAAAGRTVLLITHRPEGLDLVDRVVRLG